MRVRELLTLVFCRLRRIAAPRFRWSGAKSEAGKRVAALQQHLHKFIHTPPPHANLQGSAQFRKQAEPYMFSFSDLSSDVEALGCDVGRDVVAM